VSPGARVAVLALGLGVIVLCGVASWIIRSIYFPRRRRGRWWPVRPETVGSKMWPFVGPKAVAIAVVIQTVAALWYFLPPPWPPWVDLSLYLLAFFAMLATLYRTEVRGMPEGWVRHRPDPRGDTPHNRSAEE